MNKNRNKILILIGIAFIIVALIALVVGYTLAGEDVIGWFSSRWAIIIYVIGGIYLLIAIGLIIFDKVKNL